MKNFTRLLRAALYVLVTIAAQISYSQTITTFAGSKSYNPGDGGPAIAAGLSSPTGIATDLKGNIYFSDYSNNRIRKIDTAGIITTIAGTGKSGFSGDGGKATEATMYAPSGVAADAAGNVYFADYINNRVRKISPLGIITTIAGGGYYQGVRDTFPLEVYMPQPVALAFDKAGNLLMSGGDEIVRRLDKNGILSVIAGGGVNLNDGIAATSARLNRPIGLAVDKNGNLYIAVAGNEMIRRVDTKGIITTIAGTGTIGYSGDGGPALSAKINEPWGLAADKNGNVFFGDYNNQRVRKIAADGTIITVIGTGEQGYSGDSGLAVNAKIFNPSGICLDAEGNLFLADRGNNRIRRIVGIAAGAALPLSFLQFTAYAAGSTVKLAWKTADEYNVSRFVIERSSDGTSFDSLGVVNASAGLANSYTYNDALLKNTSPILLYRIKAVDLNGKKTYSRIQSIKTAIVSAITIYPNPAKNIFYVSGTLTFSNNAYLVLYDNLGRVALRQRMSAVTQQVVVNKLAAGTYRVSLVDNGQVVYSGGVVLQ